MNFRVALAVLGVAVVATACSGTVGGTATPSAPASTTALPYGGAPKVDNPLPDDIFSSGPCQALTPEQLKQQLGATVPGKPDISAKVQSCDFHGGTGAYIGVSYFTKDNDGLSTVYTQVRPMMKRFTPLPPIQGFPAVAYDSDPGPNSPACEVAVGVTDQLSFLLTVGLGESAAGKEDPCPGAIGVAGDVVTTLKKKAGR